MTADRVNPLRMKGRWGRFEAIVYEHTVASSSGALYDRMAGSLLPQVPTGADVLDVGCGSGPVACRVAQRRPDLRVHGVDLCADMVRRAQRRAAALGLRNVTFTEGDAAALPAADARYACVYSMLSIKHWPDPARGIAEMARVVRPGGRVVVYEADRAASWRRASNFCRTWNVPWPARAFATAYFLRVVAGQGVTTTDARRWFVAAGVGDLELRSDPDLPFVIASGGV